ncbi:hypothetical protein [Halomonas korlensis]|uniref:Uncharacterized protein n=1 Tax=Halomonas korlensis TaxID=463301 RepID=A0A1I7IYB6_9GAMM|nr:hypothetical protein [Halomonas korlensis]SFU77917.1 hypothetical protein SAMN04487955_108149 [Halomonas korlensis]
MEAGLANIDEGESMKALSTLLLLLPLLTVVIVLIALGTAGR